MSRGLGKLQHRILLLLDRKEPYHLTVKDLIKATGASPVGIHNAMRRLIRDNLVISLEGLSELGEYPVKHYVLPKYLEHYRRYKPSTLRFM